MRSALPGGRRQGEEGESKYILVPSSSGTSFLLLFTVNLLLLGKRQVPIARKLLRISARVVVVSCWRGQEAGDVVGER